MRDCKGRITFIFQCITISAIGVALISMLILSARVSNLILDETTKTIVNYLSSYSVLICTTMAFGIVTLFDLYNIMVKKLNEQDCKIQHIMMREVDQLCDECYYFKELQRAKDRLDQLLITGKEDE